MTWQEWLDSAYNTEYEYTPESGRLHLTDSNGIRGTLRVKNSSVWCYMDNIIESQGEYVRGLMPE